MTALPFARRATEIALNARIFFASIFAALKAQRITLMYMKRLLHAANSIATTEIDTGFP